MSVTFVRMRAALEAGATVEADSDHRSRRMQAESRLLDEEFSVRDTGYRSGFGTVSICHSQGESSL